jgi:hypothetical protein
MRRFPRGPAETRLDHAVSVLQVRQREGNPKRSEDREAATHVDVEEDVNARDEQAELPLDCRNLVLSCAPLFMTCHDHESQTEQALDWLVVCSSLRVDTMCDKKRWYLCCFSSDRSTASFVALSTK